MQSLPVPDWLRTYPRAWFSRDLLAGLTVGVMLVPQGMAYALLAGLPPVYGLYAAAAPPLVYALFGTSRHLAVGPVAMDSLLVAAGVGALAAPGSAEYLGLAVALALLVGVLQVVAGWLRLDFLVHFIARPVLAGFISAAAVVIVVSQLGALFGLSLARGNVLTTLADLERQLSAAHLPTIALGVFSIGLLLTLKRGWPRVPAALVLVVAAVAISRFAGLDERGVHLVGAVPSGLPGFALPELDWTTARALLPTAVVIAFIGFLESYAVGQTIQRRHGNYTVQPHRELIAVGLGNVAASLFSGFPGAGGLSRSAVNEQAGARTQVAGVVSAGLVVLTLLFLTDFFHHLPLVALSAIIVTAVVRLIDWRTVLRLWRTHRSDFWLFLATAGGTLALGVAEGILVGMVLSLGVVIFRLSRPHYAVLGRSTDGTVYRNQERFAEAVQPIPNALLFRFDAPLSYVNAAYFQSRVQQRTAAHTDLRYFLLDARAVTHIDATGMDTLREVVRELREREVEVFVVHAIGPVRDLLYREEFLDLLGEDHLLNDLDEATQWIEGKRAPSNERRCFATQHQMFG